MFFKRVLPIANFCISSSALLFQTTVLFPWHNEISEQINKLEKQNTK